MTGEIGVAEDEQRIATIRDGALRYESPADLYVYEYDWRPRPGAARPCPLRRHRGARQRRQQLVGGEAVPGRGRAGGAALRPAAARAAGRPGGVAGRAHARLHRRHHERFRLHRRRRVPADVGYRSGQPAGAAEPGAEHPGQHHRAHLVLRRRADRDRARRIQGGGAGAGRRGRRARPVVGRGNPVDAARPSRRVLRRRHHGGDPPELHPGAGAGGARPGRMARPHPLQCRPDGAGHRAQRHLARRPVRRAGLAAVARRACRTTWAAPRAR